MGVESAPNLPRIKLDTIFTNLLPMLVFESLLYMVANSCTNASLLMYSDTNSSKLLDPSSLLR